MIREIVYKRKRVVDHLPWPYVDTKYPNISSTHRNAFPNPPALALVGCAHAIDWRCYCLVLHHLVKKRAVITHPMSIHLINPRLRIATTACMYRGTWECSALTAVDGRTKNKGQRVCVSGGLIGCNVQRLPQQLVCVVGHENVQLW